QELQRSISARAKKLIPGGALAAISLLLQCEDAKQFVGNSLFHAALNNDPALVKLLQHHGVTDMPIDHTGNRTALHAAAKAGHEEVVRLLVGVRTVNMADSSSRTPLHEAASRGHTVVIEILLDNG